MVLSKNLDYLIQRLLERNRHPERSDEIDRELWGDLGADRAIVVSDMSGFTRLAKKRGITHFLGLHFQGIEIAAPIIARHGGNLIKRQADNMISSFANPVDAVRCSIAIQRALHKHNAMFDDPDSHVLFCMGIGYGHVLVLTDDTYGEEVNIAYKIGEDIAVANEILMSDAAYAAINESDITGYRFGPREIAHTGKVDIGYYRVEYLPTA